MLLQNNGYLAFRRIHVMPVMRGPGKFSKNVDQQGMADLQLYLKGGKTLHVELKAPKGKQSSEQLAFEDELKMLGHSYAVVRSLDDLIKLLEQNGIKHWSNG